MSAYVNIHPFPARMAPELALRKTEDLDQNSLVLDPMAGSGTVVRAASEHGHRCVAMDIDPLAVLMTRVSTGTLDEERFSHATKKLIERAKAIKIEDIDLPWLDDETDAFSKFWFASKQRHALLRLAHVLHHTPVFSGPSIESAALRISLSRLIVTKEVGASLARDVSHSRPHRVADKNDFDVFEQLPRSARRVQAKLEEISVRGCTKVRLGDARKLPWVRDCSVDMIMTSPPYLNAIDYMRGHRLSLIWLGHSLAALRRIRSCSVGAERAPDKRKLAAHALTVMAAVGKIHSLPNRHQTMIARYSCDLVQMLDQASRVLKRDGRAVFVIGNSCLQGVFISNAKGIEVAARLAGLDLVHSAERKLPNSSRYLPMPADSRSSLGRRMRTETVLTFRHARRTR